MSRTIAATALLLLAACGPPAREAPAEDEGALGVDPIAPEVELDHVRCDANALTARAEGVLTNNGDERAAYAVSVEFYDGEGSYYDGLTVTTPSIRPGDVSSWEGEKVHGHGSLAVGGVCEVVEVHAVPDVEQNAAPVWGDGS